MNTSKKYDYIVYIGRFAPIHNGHQTIIETALTLAEHVIVLIGSSNRPRTIRNPWTFDERANMIRQTLPTQTESRIHLVPLNDYFYNEDAWIKEIQTSVYSVIGKQEANTRPRQRPRTASELNVGIIGHQKDKTVGYLNLFPQWETVLHPAVFTPLSQPLNSTYIRKTMFEYGDKVTMNVHISPTVQAYLDAFTDTATYAGLKKEYECIKKGKDAWIGSPYEPYFITVDSLVVQSGHILLVERGSSPGKGLLALPGGFLNQDEFLLCGALRELEEETKIDCPVKVLRGSLRGSRPFDHPLRSLRGRSVTHAYYFELPPGKLPKVKGSDDAAHAMWVPFNEIKSDNMFEDHFDIITHFINIT